MRSTITRRALRSAALLIAAVGATSTQAADPSTASGGSPIGPHIVVEAGTFKAEVSDACHLRVSGVVKPPNISWKVALVREVAGDSNDIIYTLALQSREPKGRQSRTQRDECVVYSDGDGPHPPSTAEICKLKQVVVTGGDQPIELGITHPIGRTRACPAALKG